MLTIEKIIKLLDDFHYDAFRTYVKNHKVRSFYPLALIDAIDRDIEVVQSTDSLCKSLYDDTSEKTKKKFFQLAHHTFQLSTFLSKNYPAYLQNNISLIQRLINNGQLKRSNLLLDMVMDISKKKEDFATEIQACQIMVQQSLLTESTRSAMRYQLRILELLKYQQELHNLHTHFYTIYNLKEKDSTTKSDFEAGEDYFRNYFGHNNKLVQIVSTYYYCFLLHYNRSEKFYSKDTFDYLEQTELLLNKNQTIIFPFLLDLQHRLGYLRLKYWNDRGEVEEARAYILNLFKDSSDLLYWNSFINSSETAMLAIQTNLFARDHLNLLDLEQSKYILSDEAKSELLLIKTKLQQFIDNEHLKENYALRYINICTLLALLMLCGDREMIKSGIITLDGALTSFQQIPFGSYVGSIYSILGTAYFKLKNYEGVDANFKRYKKQTKDQNVHPVNDLTIHAIYYTAKWLNTQKNQYAKKFAAIYESTQTDILLKELNKNLTEVVDTYQIPI